MFHRVLSLTAYLLHVNGFRTPPNLQCDVDYLQEKASIIATSTKHMRNDRPLFPSAAIIYMSKDIIQGQNPVINVCCVLCISTLYATCCLQGSHIKGSVLTSILEVQYILLHVNAWCLLQGSTGQVQSTWVSYARQIRCGGVGMLPMLPSWSNGTTVFMWGNFPHAPLRMRWIWPKSHVPRGL